MKKKKKKTRRIGRGDSVDSLIMGSEPVWKDADKLTPEERWAVVAYLRALQLSQFCPPEITPASIKATAK